MSGDAVAFVLGLQWGDVPRPVRSRLELLLRDFVAVSVAGRVTPTARLAADYAAAQHPGEAATALLDGRRLGVTGAAWANGVLANALDFDDGHRLAKGHPGSNVIPAALAAAEAAGAGWEEFATAVAAGYEIAIRAAIELHERSGEYHASGAWGSLGAAAAAARLLGLDAQRTRHALGLAEFHAPLAPVLRSVGDPAMTKDACGWGAFVGVSSALLARAGFTALESGLRAIGLGRTWELLQVYVKEFPCCRWAHPSIAAAARLRSTLELDPADVVRVRVRTFGAAAALARELPATTEEAQYSLVWPVAAALRHGCFGVEHVLPPAFGDRETRRLASLVEIEVDPELERAFPARRLSELVVELAGGAVHTSGPTEAPGEPDDPRWEEIVETKFAELAAEAVTDDGVALLLGGQFQG